MIYMKDGAVIRGTIVGHILGESVTVRLDNGSELVCDLVDILGMDISKLGFSATSVRRSCLLPGMGQLYGDKPVRGVLFLSGFASAITMMAFGLDDNSSNDRFRGDYELHPDNDNALIWSVLGLILISWGWSMVDAPVDTIEPHARIPASSGRRRV